VLGVLVPCEEKCIQQVPESSFGCILVVNEVQMTVPDRQTGNGESPEASAC